MTMEKMIQDNINAVSASRRHNVNLAVCSDVHGELEVILSYNSPLPLVGTDDYYNWQRKISDVAKSSQILETRKEGCILYGRMLITRYDEIQSRLSRRYSLSITSYNPLIREPIPCNIPSKNDGSSGRGVSIKRCTTKAINFT